MKGLSIVVKFIGKFIQRPNSKCDEIKIRMNPYGTIIFTTISKMKPQSHEQHDSFCTKKPTLE